MTEKSTPTPLFSAQFMGAVMWALFGTLLLNAVFIFGRPFWDLESHVSSWQEALKYTTRALMLSLPTFIMAGAIFDLATFFHRCDSGERFTARNIETLKSAGQALFWVTLISALFAPTVIAWIDGETRSLVWRTNDLTLGIGAMGIGVFGFANVLSDAVDLQTENDEFV